MFQSLGGTNFAYCSAFAPDLWSEYSTKAAPANAARVRACACNLNSDRKRSRLTRQKIFFNITLDMNRAIRKKAHRVSNSDEEKLLPAATAKQCIIYLNI